MHWSLSACSLTKTDLSTGVFILLSQAQIWLAYIRSPIYTAPSHTSLQPGSLKKSSCLMRWLRSALTECGLLALEDTWRWICPKAKPWKQRTQFYPQVLCRKVIPQYLPFPDHMTLSPDFMSSHIHTCSTSTIYNSSTVNLWLCCSAEIFSSGKCQVHFTQKSLLQKSPLISHEPESMYTLISSQSFAHTSLLALTSFTLMLWFTAR